jgi:hypothetical protein
MAHRNVKPRLLSVAVADLALTRLAAYDAYRRRRGPAEAHQIPNDLPTLMSAVTDFADPIFSDGSVRGMRWDASSRSWQPAR